MSLKVWTSRSKQVGTTLHSSTESIDLKTQTESSHLRSSNSCLKKLMSPVVHLLFPVWKSFRDDLRKIVACLFRSLTYLPHVSPFHIVCGWENWSWLIFIWKVFYFFIVISGLLNFLWGNTSLIMVFWFFLRKFLTFVVFLGSLIEVLFH